MDTLWMPTVSDVRECTVGVSHNRQLVQSLIRDWHSILPNPVPGWRVAFIMCAPDGLPLAVATWGRPIARLEDQITTLELTRQANGPYAPRNSSTFMLGRMRRWIRANMPNIKRLISYQDADRHLGTIYKADNWRCVGETYSDASWTNRAGRLGTERKHKMKWEREP